MVAVRAVDLVSTAEANGLALSIATMIIATIRASLCFVFELLLPVLPGRGGIQGGCERVTTLTPKVLTPRQLLI